VKNSIRVICTKKKFGGIISLPASKSETNRMLIIRALSGNTVQVDNISSARDSYLMQKLLSSSETELDVQDAGTTMRFLTAFFGIGNSEKIIKGTERMHQRPIGLLVDSLKKLGAQIEYLGKEGYPPLKILPFHYSGTNQISIPGNISSQFISALLLISPNLPEGIEINIEGEVYSRPYIEMTLQLMGKMGIDYKWGDGKISVPAQQYKKGTYSVESDWSAASYWYGIAALSDKSDFFLKGLLPDSLQGDSAITSIMKSFGVDTVFEESGARMIKSKKIPEKFIHDFKECPDLAQTIAVLCAALQIEISFTGLESLRIKETDRITALQNELKKVGVELVEKNNNWIFSRNNFKMPEKICFSTYHDHRMAMAFAPLAVFGEIEIEHPEVVNKSYPEFWTHLGQSGFNLR
jgi:3-phosphoshikimate 1-carboxyvinyltransferase